MKQVPLLECYLLDTGYCLAWEDHVLQGGRHRRIHCHSLVALLHHPEHGWLLWDTGYAPRMLDVTQQLPFSLYRRATPLCLSPELAVVAQLPRWGLNSSDIHHIILSHFHADHIAGLRDFPDARLIATQSAYRDVAPRRGLNALRRGYIPALMPEDFSSRTTLLPAFSGKSLSALGPTHDLFNDGSILLVELPGHAKGQIGMLAQTQRGALLFAADSCWLARSISERRPPHPITQFFIDDAQALHTTIEHLYTFSQACPEVIILPSHCPETFEREVQA